MDGASTHLGTWQYCLAYLRVGNSTCAKVSQVHNDIGIHIHSLLTQPDCFSPPISRLLLFPTQPRFSVTVATVCRLHQPWNWRPDLLRSYQLVPGGTRTCALPDWVQQDLQLDKQLVHKNAHNAAAHEGSQQVVLRRHINNDKNDKGNTSVWDVTCVCVTAEHGKNSKGLGLQHTTNTHCMGY